MSTLRPYRFWWLPPLLAAVAGLIFLAATLLAQGLQAGAREALMLAWVLSFVVGLPVLLLVLALASHLRAALRHRLIIPVAGERIPDSGQ